MSSNASVIMSSNMERLLKLVDSGNTNPNISFKNHTCMTRRVTIWPPPLDSIEEETFFDCQNRLASDSEDDFHSVNGELMSSCPAEEEIELTKNLEEPFWSDKVVHVDRRDQILTVNKEIKLAQFLQDSSWIQQVVANDNHHLSCTRNVARFKSKDTKAKPRVCRKHSKGDAENGNDDKENMTKATACYSWLSFRKRARQNHVSYEK